MDKLKSNGNENAKDTFYLTISYYLDEAVLEAFLEPKTITPCVIIAYVQTIWYIVDALYNQLSERKDYIALIKGLKAEGKNDDIKNIYEAFFIFAFMWLFGATVDEGKILFSGMLKSRVKIKFAEQGQCYNYWYDPLKMD